MVGSAHPTTVERVLGDESPNYEASNANFQKRYANLAPNAFREAMGSTSIP